MKKRSAGDLALHPIAESIYFYRGYFSNSAVFVLPKSVLVVDTQVAPLAARRLKALIAQVTPLPIKTVINTHYHGDHTGGNGEMEGAEIIATEETARFVGERDKERVEYAETFGLAFQEVHPTQPPTRTFTGKLELDVDGERIEVLQLGRVETPDACVVHWPKRRAIACGDGVATHDYPYLGVPFLDEGLRDDGSWLAYLDAIRKMEPQVLLPGHGPALIGRQEIQARIDLLVSLMRDLIGAVRAELDAKTPIPDIVERVDRKLEHYRRRGDLKEHTVSQRFAIYRCINNMIPERKGRGWWDDLRPSVIERASSEDAEREIQAIEGRSNDATGAVMDRAREQVASREAPRAIALLEAWLERHGENAAVLGLLSDVLFACARGVTPRVDATEYIAASTKAARRALAIDAGEPLGLLNLGSAEVFGASVLAQPMVHGIEKLTRALETGVLTPTQRQRAMFFLGRAHQLEDRPDQSDRFFKQMLPAWARFVYPLLRERIRSYP
jgi:glyoxylase-like metal-dependent hydrolase (beta-lactamase superfamily II)